MAHITWILANGAHISDDVANGTNLMDAAQFNGVTGTDGAVLGECGGCLSCATCHVYVDEAWVAACGTVSDTENAMLDIVPHERKRTSRLSCQIIAIDMLDGLILHVPR